jgi:Beta-galactosidase C-terminal domain
MADAGSIIPAAGIETVRRRRHGVSYLFVINHTDQEVDVTATGDELAAGAVAVIHKGVPTSATTFPPASAAAHGMG